MTLPTAPVTSTKATLGLVFAFLVAPLGLVLSIIAMKETRSGARGGHGLAVAGAVIGALGSMGWLLVAATMVWVISQGTS